MVESTPRWEEIEAAFGSVGCDTAVALRRESWDDGETGELARRREYLVGRELAAEAIGLLGRAPVEVGRGPMREPLWPTCVTGSITHGAGTVAVVVATVGSATSLGIDVEAAGSFPADALPMWFTPRELDGGFGRSRHTATVGFSLKEALYKAMFPIVGRLVDPLEVELDWRGTDPIAVTTPAGVDPARVGLFSMEHGLAVVSGAVIRRP